ncbi:hypothetical protein PLEOSDRAFT_1110331 [Pleurotus ostreatus PC15]|uniref:Uncharacterized protein n=1 Tax=Pleurotus ostreatus (strain PC15) TaxID=1137138 RepID=A0A067P969_PLEO1|nr:hypothetical protein PLEOSDRAFT_1110331 [Pleurotus ostreatus PC15]
MEDSLSNPASSSSTVFIIPSTADLSNEHERTPSPPLTRHPHRPPSPVLDDPPSPPDSPSLTDPGSVSSLPSVSSSFFFSSAAATPPLPSEPHSLDSLPHVQGHAVHTRPQQDHHSDTDPQSQSTRHLIIPSLSLPAALRRPTAYGQSLGDVRVLVMKLSDTDNDLLGHSADPGLDIGRLLVENNEDIVDVGGWEPFHPQQSRSDEPLNSDPASWRILRASTDWIEHQDAYGLEKYEPSRNIEIIEVTIRLPHPHSLSYDSEYESSEQLIRSTLTNTLTELQSFLAYPFRELTDVLSPSLPPYTSSLVHNLLAASGSPLCVGLVLLYDLYHGDERSALLGPRQRARQAFDPRVAVAEHIITESLSSYVPVIKLPSTAAATMLYPSIPQSTLTRRRDPTHTHVFSPHYLQPGTILRSNTLPSLRREAAERFLRWYEIDRIVGHFGVPVSRKLITPSSNNNNPSSSTLPSQGRDLVGTVKGHQSGKSAKRKLEETTFEDRKSFWESDLSIQVARRRLAAPSSFMSQQQSESHPEPDTPAQRTARPLSHSTRSHSFIAGNFDPLHLPSVLWFSLSLLGPFSRRISNSIIRVVPWTSTGDKAALAASDSPPADETKLDTAVTPYSRRKKSKSKPFLSTLRSRRWIVGVVGVLGVGVGFLVGVGISLRG